MGIKFSSTQSKNIIKDKIVIYVTEKSKSKSFCKIIFSFGSQAFNIAEIFISFIFCNFLSHQCLAP